MNKESVLGITGPDVATTIERSGIFKGGDIAAFAERVQKDMVEEQPELYAFLASVGKNPNTTPSTGAFVVGMSHTYDMISEEQRANPLTRDLIMSVIGTLQEHRATELHNGAEVEVHNPMSWLEDLAKDSPVFALWLQQTSRLFRTHEEQLSFVQAGFFTAMPFIIRDQGKELERQFFPEG